LEFIKSNDIEKFFKNNSEFHNLIYQSSNNNRLIQIINSLIDNFTRYRLMLLSLSHMPEQSYLDHKNMIAEMEKGNAEKVKSLVKKHILSGGERLIEYINQADLGIII
jgi:DNA-binding GntR family transcriptional regulator